MKAIHCRKPGGLDKIEIADIAEPGDPKAGEIRVRLHATSLNYHDYNVVMGMLLHEDKRIPMSDGAGVVEAVGEGVTEFTPGDHVVSVFFPQWLDGPPRDADFRTVPGDGVDGYARKMVVTPAHWFTKAPKGYSHEEAATLTCAGLTAWRALIVDGPLKPGDTVLCLGTGGVSIFALQIAKAMGARVAITSSSDEKLARCREMGADFTANYKQTEDWGKAVLNWTEGRGADHIVEVGGPATLPQSITACAIGGHIALLGVLTGIQGDIPTAAMFRKQIRLQGLIVGSRANQLDFVRALETTGIKPVIDRTFPIDELGAAFKHEADGKHFGKIVATI